ncbi:G-type lectin S-receptor-like serine/threonine-protein kinase [Quillaja saponaria]|uniref:non-specific serine/threonine protein kinase n=1 Tax=Quillaja saponaria TaxID=32244 RepID=A0AAD7PAA2_QUISA|nr:G-type lectin S-receptor-like serine/threonine-protein kinase [Quillaja saponaria]
MAIPLPWSAYHILCSTCTLNIFFLLLLCVSSCCARDTLVLGNPIRDSQGDTLVSAGGKFELGFFTPDGSSKQVRYVGIWYSRLKPQTVVWIANRTNPLHTTTGEFCIAKDGNLKVMGENEIQITNLGMSSSFNRTLKLTNSGNLILSNGNEDSDPLWQSFGQPTDTFLPGMKIDEDFQLISWTSQDDPGKGNFIFQHVPDSKNQYMITNGSEPFWKSGVWGGFSGEASSVRSYLNFSMSSSKNSYRLGNKTRNITQQFDYENTRLVMKFDGELQCLRWDSSSALWTPLWKEPRDKCSFLDVCGNFGICNSENRLQCKCLPGFKPKNEDSWNSGDFSEGCFRRSSSSTCSRDDEKRSTTGSGTCSIWDDEVKNIQEYTDGDRQDLFVRVELSDIKPMQRGCEVCGSNTIPYPLSTGPNCGDPLYFSFTCSFGRVSFRTPGGTYRLRSINPELRRFSIQVYEHNCTDIPVLGEVLKLPKPSPFYLVSGCNHSVTEGLSSELEIGWNTPLEPICNSTKDCNDWQHSTCDIAPDGSKRCLCKSNFIWDPVNVNCSEAEELSKSQKSSGSLHLIIPLIIVPLIVISCSSIYIWLLRRKRATSREVDGETSQRNPAFYMHDNEQRIKDLIISGEFKEDDKKGIEVPYFPLETILAATDNFSEKNKLGQGGFGPVYMGTFPGEQKVAIKRLSSGSGQGLEEFKNEVILLAKLQHRNLVRVLGYCLQRDEKMLIYEFMPNRSLDSFLFDRTLCVLLNWQSRFNIILGIARGLLYLHQDSRLRIIHRDLKTSNILLDEEMNPKISDFGLARIFGGKQTEASTNRVVGTYGYMSPEYALDGFFSVKSDIFSFGVVVLEIISGKRNTGFSQSEHAVSLLGYAWKLWIEEKAFDLLDPTLRETLNGNEFLRCVNIGLMCVQEDPSDRPTMSNVIFMLSGETATLPRPRKPAFVVRRSLAGTASTSSSQPELTVSLEQGR